MQKVPQSPDHVPENIPLNQDTAKINVSFIFILADSRTCEEEWSLLRGKNMVPVLFDSLFLQTVEKPFQNWGRSLISVILCLEL